MDGHFVPNLTIGPPIVKALKPHAKMPLDVHLMISPVDPFLEAFAEAGADGITVHPEAGPHIHRTLQLIRSLGKKPGIALNPGTPVDHIDGVLDLVDLVLIMTVNPGFGGQSFITSQLKKIEAAAERIAKSRARDRARGRRRHHAANGEAGDFRRRQCAGRRNRGVQGRSRRATPPTSLRCEGRGVSAGQTKRPPLALFPEAAGVVLWRMGGGWRRWRRASWLYRRLLKGPLADRIAFHPYDALPRRLEDADALLRGRFRFDGETRRGERPLDLRCCRAVARLGRGAAWLRLAAAFVRGGRRCRADAGDQSGQPMAEALCALFRAGLAAACHGAASGQYISRMAASC